ncbi:phosphoribosyltransferase family protein [Bizionia myxarmorum]|uniref:Phosphoribosyltransferase n=1 Tax=Bizionia myxarmorum TaxID=291186 RepID=A0A5D0RF85_9FLAO|nr:phosphoribosyltransferase family protein [Bizionia myxarmorum]TYB79611.1 phosphoribosyltransferase [Bizionia myxarmorum]
MKTSEKNIILNHDEIVHKIRRIAYQIYESNVDETEIVLAGIDSNGYILAKKLKAVLAKISTINPVLCRVMVDKKNPLNQITTSLAVEDYTNKSVVLIDDVLNSGTTLIYGVKHFLNVPLKQFKTAVLVNRNHKKYPVKADFKGISLSTSLHEHVDVVLDGKVFEASLN